MAETVRFAPSPTGEIHIGNVRTALYNAFQAMGGGHFILRFDDTDAERSQTRFKDQIRADLSYLGVTPNTVVSQSERLPRYNAAAADLRERGLLYACYETADELERKRGRQRARGLPPIYDRAGLTLGAEERAALEAQGRRPHWRFKLPGGTVRWVDGCRGEVQVDLGSVSDPVLVREDGSYLYTLPSVVDDADMAVSLVVRGEDHVTNTGVQIALFDALGAAVPRFAHHNLLVRADGEPLSKRDNPLSIARLAADGFEPMAVASLAVLTGTSQPVQPVASLGALAGLAPLDAVSRSPAMFDPAELDRLNAALLHEMPFEAARPFLEPHGVADEAFWLTVRGNLEKRGDVALWRDVLRQPPEPSELSEADAHVLAMAAEALPPEPWDEGTFKAWTAAIRSATGAKGKALFMPLRRALTGLDHGPELGPLIRLMGRETVAERLRQSIAAARV